MQVQYCHPSQDLGINMDNGYAKRRSHNKFDDFHTRVNCNGEDLYRKGS